MPTSVSKFSASQGAKKIIFSDDFLDPKIPQWEKWDGPAGGGNGDYNPSQVRQYNSMVSLACREDQSGGIGVLNSQVGGRYEVRLKVNEAPDTDYVALLWPPDNDWKNEWDFFERNSQWDSESLYQATYHWGPDRHSQVYAPYLTGWNTYGTTWYPGERVTLDINNIVVGQITDPAISPSQPMHLVLEVLSTGILSSFSNMLVDWAVIYSIQ